MSTSTTLPEVTVTATRLPVKTAGKLDARQVSSDHLETTYSLLDGRQAALHTAMPGIIVSFDAGKMTAVVQPALQGIRTMKDGTTQNVTIAHLPDVPVAFPGGGGHTLTFPVTAGDECMLVFQERSIDFWHQLGNVQKPSDWRMHDINDAICHVGMRSTPRVLNPPVDTGTTQLRSDDKKTLVQVDGKNNAITLYASGASESVVFVDGKSEEVTVLAKTINLHATNKVSISAPNVDVKSGNFTSGA